MNRKTRTSYGKSTKGQLNINSIRNNIGPLRKVMEKNVDLFLVVETKIEDSYPTEQFLIPDFSEPHRLDRNEN